MLMLYEESQQAQTKYSLETLLQASLDAKHAQIVDLAPELASDQQDYGDLYVKLDPQLNEAPVVKGLYASAHSVAGQRFSQLLELADTTELNAFVIDVKEDFGYITYPTEDENLKQYDTVYPIMKDVPALMQTLDEHDIYPIARIVVFKDSKLATIKPEWSFVQSDGTIWKNGRDESFVNPYVKEVWDYNVAIAKEAAALGFKEIQFDYVRFPEGFENRADTLTYTKDERARIDVVSDFVRYAREALSPLDVRVSVDIFGYAASVPAAEGIGQDFNKISQFVDVISPMVYPSHYSTGWFGANVPDAAPYVTINGAMIDTHEKLAEIEQLKPIIRPWIQDFTASWVPGNISYGKKEVEAQIKALEDNNIHEFLLWNASNRYTPDVDYTPSNLEEQEDAKE
ncbi:putative glycoside hydrolase [Longirhabdus pacifica]|uniref:putative glycoside hydrolase n=1 Tax=Longirhabdus pacifica TaxID=2305227 RepID=UPI003522F03C